MTIDVYRNKISITADPSELGAGKYGTSVGVADLAEFFENKFQNSEIQFAPVVNKTGIEKSFKVAKEIEQIYHNLLKSYFVIKTELEKGGFVINILGDHSNAIATFSAFSDIYGIENSGLIWVDAHADFHSPYTTPSGNIHGMPLSALTTLDNTECAKNELTTELKAWWDRFKNIGLQKRSPKLLAKNIVIIGLRDYEEEEEEVLKRENVKFFKPEDIKSKGIETVWEESLEYLSDCDSISCSFDIDSMDKSLVKGTGTPVENGLSLEQAKFVINQVFKNKVFKALDITEFNPTLDGSGKTFENVTSLFN